MAFVEQEDVIAVVGDLLIAMIKAVCNLDVGPIKRMTWHEVELYGSDKPDLRIPLFFVPIDGCARIVILKSSKILQLM